MTNTTLVSFTSCEEDDHSYWTTGTLDYPTTATISPAGTFGFDVTIDENWIVMRGAGRYTEIRDLRFLGGEINISIDKYKYIDWLDLRIRGTNIVLPFEDMEGNTQDKTKLAQDFLKAMTYDIARYGYVIIEIDGEGDPRTGFDVNFGMDLEVYVRD